MTNDNTDLTNSFASATIPTLEQEITKTTDTDFPLNHWGYSLNNTLYKPITTTTTTLKATDTGINNDTTTLNLATRVDLTKPAGTYTNTFVFTAVVNFYVAYTDVTNETELANAFAAGRNPRLANDIKMSAPLVVSQTKPLYLNLNGHALVGTGASSVMTLAQNTDLTILDEPADATSHYFIFKNDDAWEYISAPTSIQISAAVEYEDLPDMTPVSGTTIVVIHDGIITNGYAADNKGGGGISTEGKLTFSGGTIIGNKTAFTDGGAGNINGGGIAVNTTTPFNMNGDARLIGNASGRGGGIAISNNIITEGGTLNFYNQAEIAYNYSASYAGGIIAWTTGATITLNNDVIVAHNKTAGYYGGGIFGNTSATITLNDSASVLNNMSQYAGGIYGGPSSAITLNGTTSVSYNTASNGYGGGIFGYTSSITLNNSASISNNTANNYGGGIQSQISATVILNDDSSIFNNTAKQGGGIHSTTNSSNAPSTVILNGNASIYGNTAQYGGGLMNNNYCTATLNDNASISNNTASAAGGILGYASSVVTLNDNSSIHNNTATNADGMGGGFYGNSSSTIILNGSSSIFANTATVRGGGIAGNQNTIIINNGTSVINNHSPIGGGIATAEGSSKTIRLSGNVQITGNTTLDNATPSNIDFTPSDTLNITGPLTGSRIGISVSAPLNPFTSGYGTFNPGINPSTYFFSDNSAYHIDYDTSGNEAAIK